MNIRTNNVPRPILDSSELTEDERKEFDYLDWEKLDEGTDSASFFRYKGEVYDLGNFTRTDAMPEWDGSQAFSAFSGLLVRTVMVDGEASVVVAYCWW